MKWTKFSSGELPKTRVIWITDYEDIWIKEISELKNGNIERAWKSFASDIKDGLSFCEIELPQVPKKKLHHCEFNDFSCRELDDELILIDERPAPVDEIMRVKVCPFCGYSIKEKE